MDVVRPVVRAKVLTPAGDPCAVHRLKRAFGFADVVVSGHAEHRREKSRKSRCAVTHVLLDIRSVDRDVSRMYNKVGLLRPNPGEQRLPVAYEVRLAGTKVGV